MAGLPAMATKLIMVKSGSEAADLDITHLKSIGDQSTEADEIDVTTLDSPNRAKEFIQGAKDAGTMDFVINDMFDGQVEALDAVFDTGEVRRWKVVFPDGKGGFAFNGFIKNFTNGEVETDGLITRTLTIRLSGKPQLWEGQEPAES